MTHAQIHQQLLEQGYHIGTLDELLNSETGYDLELFNLHTETFRSTTGEKMKRYDYRHNFTAQNDSKVYLEKPGYTGPHPTEEEAMHDIPYSKVAKRKEFIEAVQAGGGGIRTTQQWGKLMLNNLPGDENRISEMDLYFRGLIRKHLALVYPELREEEDTFVMNPAYSLYTEGDFSEVHYDGINPGRICVMIIYLADPATWDKTKGGELVVGHEIAKGDDQIQYFLAPYEKCPPVYGNYAIMDFTKWNVGHSIERVGAGFERIAIQTFADIKPL